MRYLSVCSGIEAASVAWGPLGWTAAAFSEIEPFPCAALAHHYPSTPNWGDMTCFHEWPNADIDLLIGGTPCQSFSVAGLRAGLDDPRGSLMLTYLSLARRYRPRWLVWENVPGVLSADKGQAFGSLLGGLAELGYGFAYRVLDAQYFGLAQRRKRVFVVGHLGDWRRAAAVLFERESLSGHPAPRREAGEVVTGTLTSCSDTSRKHGHGWGQQELTNGFAVPVAGTLSSNHGNIKAEHAWTGQLIAGPGGDDLSHALSSRDVKGPCSNLAQGTLIAHARRADGFDASEDGTGRGTPLVPVAFHNRQDPDVSGDVTHPIGAKDNGMAVAQAMQVRRLTPRECERLQGFPDDYTLIPYRGKPAADGPRYKALGNSMAVPVVHWIGQRIAFVDTV